MSSLGISLLALFSGCLLALMVFFNGLLAKFIRPLEASLVIHLIGLVAAFGLVLAWKLSSNTTRQPVPKWSYLTGIFGGIAVAIVGVTVNSPLGIAGTVGLMVLGQVLFGWVNDTFGLFGSAKRRLTGLDFVQAIFILLGAGVIIYG